MFANTRSAKRRRTASYNPDPEEEDNVVTSTPNQKPKAPSSSRRNALPNGHAKDNDKFEQPDDNGEDELAADSPQPLVKSARSTRSTAKSSASGTPTSSRRTAPEKQKRQKIAKDQSTDLNGLSEPKQIEVGIDVTASPLKEKTNTRTKRGREQNAVFKDKETPERSAHIDLDQKELHFDPSLTSSQIETLKAAVLEKLVGRRASLLSGVDEERQKVHDLLKQTVTAGEGNSMLIIGARGTGKSTMVNELLKNLSRDNQEHFHVIRLNGFMQTDDKLALREIWRQLGRELEVEEDSGPVKNYADTLATLLAVLSHPSEISSDTNPEQVAKSVIFVLDEFDLFASHPRQTLLYNLFDVAQSRKAPIAVLGLTTRVDIAESLEKRVKSRFSHRYVHLTLPKSLAIFTETCRSVLHLQPEDLTFNEQITLTQPPETTPKSKTKKDKNKPSTQAILITWNETIDAIINDPSTSSHLARIYHTSRSIPTALSTFILPVSMLSSSPSSPAFFDFSLLQCTLPPDSKLSLLPSLPTLALALLVAAARLDIILDTDLCNFNMAYDEYVSQTSKDRVAASVASSSGSIAARAWSRQTARAMWEKLLELELLVPANAGSGGAAGGGGGVVVAVPDTEMVKCDVALEEIAGSVPDMEAWLEKWCREI